MSSLVPSGSAHMVSRSPLRARSVGSGSASAGLGQDRSSRLTAKKRDMFLKRCIIRDYNYSSQGLMSIFILIHRSEDGPLFALLWDRQMGIMISELRIRMLSR